MRSCFEVSNEATENKAHFFCRTLFVCCNQSYWIAVHLCQRNQPWINYSEICERFVATLSLKSTIIFVISAAVYEGGKNNPAMFRCEWEVMQFCFALQRLWKMYAAYMNEIIVIMQTLNMMSLAVRSLLQLCAVLAYLGADPSPLRHHHKHTHMPVASRGLWSAQ